MNLCRLVLLRGAVPFLLSAGFVMAWFPGEAVAAAPVVTITPVAGASASGSYQDGEVVNITVQRNSVFTPGDKVNVLECADPQGTTANLPKDISGCDGLTIQGDTVLVQPGGAVSLSRYPIYQLPSRTLGEQANAQPVCDRVDECVLYVGQNQNDFTQPKLFSAPFTVTPASGAPVVASGSATSSATSSPPAATATTAPSTAAASDSQGSLAFTGPGRLLAWMAAIGGALLVAGAAGRRWARLHP